MRGKHQLLAVLVGACLLLALPRPSRAQTTITVNSNSDTSSMSNCVLRDAITASNSITTTGGCTVGMDGPPFSIVFDPSLVGDTITLGSTLPTITSPTILTITGPTSSSSGITIDGNNSVQIMQVNSGATLNLQFLTLAHGSVGGTGGAILNNGTLAIADCTLSNNQATGFGRGGAILNAATLTITNSTFSTNHATGVYTGPPYYCCPGQGGAIFNGQGGASYNSSGTLTVTNTTFSGNEATGGPASGGGAIFDTGVTLTLTNATFSGNPDAIYNSGSTVNLKGAILAGSGI